MLIYLKNGALEQLQGASVNPWHQDIEFKKQFILGYEEELIIEAHEALYLISGNFFVPSATSDKKELKELILRIKKD